MLTSWTYFMRSVKSISHFYTASVLQGLEVKKWHEIITSQSYSHFNHNK